ncbi:unnamed protein product [Ilex paraguariensis]|uniref:Uncharacterized protein n=1 Tax=Ilex paraguariensis TaxID=185542 RepID=A0ABC8REY5_9AQUA
MKQTEVGAKSKKSTPPPPPSFPRFWVAIKPAVETVSITNQEPRKITSLLPSRLQLVSGHAISRVVSACRSGVPKEDDYRLFEESLKEDDDRKENDATVHNSSKVDQNNKELCAGIKDWWTKIKFAYLNQPAMDTPKRRNSTYLPNFCTKPAVFSRS